jgi:hypothetical protein
MSKEATKLALEALMHEMKYVLCCINLDIVPFDGDDFHEALRLGEEALVADLSAPKQEQGEPVGECIVKGVIRWNKSYPEVGTKLYTTPQPKQEQGEPKQEEYLSKAYRLANELRCHLAIAPAPQQRTWERPWVSLTDDEQTKLFTDWDEDKGWGPFIEAVEAKLKEKNT